jgi:hypothetical protein
MLYAKQQSAFSAFRYQIFNANQHLIGTLVWPDFALATNSRLKNSVPDSLSKVITFDIEGQMYEISFEYLNRQWSSDIRFNLLLGKTMLATADVVTIENKAGEDKPFFNRKSMLIHTPFEGRLIKKSTFLRTQYWLEVNQSVVGQMAEKKLLSFKRNISIDLPSSISVPVQVFLFFLLCNHAYR